MRESRADEVGIIRRRSSSSRSSVRGRAEFRTAARTPWQSVFDGCAGNSFADRKIFCVPAHLRIVADEIDENQLPCRRRVPTALFGERGEFGGGFSFVVDELRVVKEPFEEVYLIWSERVLVHEKICVREKIFEPIGQGCVVDKSVQLRFNDVNTFSVNSFKGCSEQYLSIQSFKLFQREFTLAIQRTASFNRVNLPKSRGFSKFAAR